MALLHEVFDRQEAPMAIVHPDGECITAAVLDQAVDQHHRHAKPLQTPLVQHTNAGRCDNNAVHTLRLERLCGRNLALEHNGDAYSCDHFVEPAYKLGNINETHIIELASSVQQMLFGLDKRDKLTRYCQECEVRFACHGECPKNRFLTTPDGEASPGGEVGLNYLCAGFKHFFHHIDQPAKLMVGLMRRGRPAAEVMQILAAEEAKLKTALAQAKRNDPCPCGSGRKVKQCHGRPKPKAAAPKPLPQPQRRSNVVLDI